MHQPIVRRRLICPKCWEQLTWHSLQWIQVLDDEETVQVFECPKCGRLEARSATVLISNPADWVHQAVEPLTSPAWLEQKTIQLKLRERLMSVQLLLKNKGSFVPAIRSGLTLKDVIDKLDVDNAGALVITDDDRNILGIITERDIARGLKTFGRDVVDKPLRELMTKEVITCEISQPLTTVLQLMDEHQIHYVPITENGQLCGIINMLDLVKYRLNEIEAEADELKAYVTGSR